MNIEAVSDVYQKLSRDNLHLLNGIYHEDVIFEDAAHRLEGWSELSDYFESLYQNVHRCDFDIHTQQQVGDSGFLTWSMLLQHPKLQGGQKVTVNGASHLKFQNDKVIYHRDYFDLGEMIYENIPLLGSVIRSIKQRLGQ